jgi:hypothetical protein
MTAAPHAPTHRVVAINDDIGAPVSTRPPHVADVAQARVFEDLLEAELADLQANISALHDRWQRHAGSKRDDRHQPNSLVRHGELLSELHCLLAALRARFPPVTNPVIPGVYAHE